MRSASDGNLRFESQAIQNSSIAQIISKTSSWVPVVSAWERLHILLRPVFYMSWYGPRQFFCSWCSLELIRLFPYIEG